MSEYNVNPGNVEWVVKKMASSLAGSEQFTLGEVLLGISELMGRTIVGAAENPVAGLSMVQVVHDHMIRTVSAGFASKGYTINGN